MPKKILIVDESPLFRDYLYKKLSEYGLDVIKALNGLDASGKINSIRPDLIICDYFLTQRDIFSLLKAKQQDTGTASIPVILVSTKINREKAEELIRLGVKKFFTKPIKVDLLLGAVSELLGQRIQLDPSPCILETHMNEDMLFIELAKGFNIEKIGLLEFKIAELLKLYHVEIPKILLMVSDAPLRVQDKPKLEKLLEILVRFTRGRVKWIKILTQSSEIGPFVKSVWEYNEISVVDTLDKAMDELMGKSTVEGGRQDKILETAGKKDEESTLELRFEKDNAFQQLSAQLNSEGNQINIAVVDDDFIAQEIIKNTFSEASCVVHAFDSGIEFMDKIPKDLDLIFLDLMMPGMNGFEVMQNLKLKGISIPIIVLSALSRRDTVLKAMGFGIVSYITKPIKPQEVLRKAYEVVGSDF